MSEPAQLEANDEPAEDAATRFPDAPEDDLVHYDGQWVAVRDGTVIANADTEELLREDPRVGPLDLVFPIGEPPSGFYLINV